MLGLELQYSVKEKSKKQYQITIKNKKIIMCFAFIKVITQNTILTLVVNK